MGRCAPRPCSSRILPLAPQPAHTSISEFNAHSCSPQVRPQVVYQWGLVHYLLGEQVPPDGPAEHILQAVAIQAFHLLFLKGPHAHAVL